MRPRTRLTALLAAGAAALAGCGGDDAGDLATLAPASSHVYVEATVRPDGEARADLQAATQKLLGTDDPGEALARLAGPALQRKGLDFERDVEPWLGDRAAKVVTGAGEGRRDGAALVATTDGDAALATVRKGEQVTERSHRGVDYGVTADGHASAIVEDTLVVGAEPAVRAVIDVAEGETEDLAGAERYTRAREDADAAEAPGFLYVDVARVLRAATDAAAQHSPQAGLALAAADIAGLQTLGVGFEADGEALRARGALRSREPLPQGRGDASAALAGAPADSLVAVGIGDVGGTVQAALASLDGIAGVGVQALLGQLQQRTGLDLQGDVLRWMGDARLHVRGTSLSTATAALVVQSKDPAASRATLSRLGALLGGRETSVAGADVAFRLGGQSVPVVLAAGGERVVLGIGAEAAADALAGGGATLQTDERFRAASGLLTDGLRPSVFADPAGLAALMGGASGEAGEVLARLGALVAGSEADGELQRFQGVVALK